MQSQAKKKICFVNATSEIGGADLSLLALVRGLSSETYEKIVVLPHSGPYVNAYRDAGARVEFIPLRKLKNTFNPAWHVAYGAAFIPTALRFFRFFKKENPDIVHLNASILLQAGCAAVLARRPLVWHVREMGLKPRSVAGFITRVVSALADRIICISQAVAAEYPKTSNLTVIYNGIDFSGMPGEGPHGNRKLLAVARFVPFKGLENVIVATEQLRKEFPDLSLTLVGGPVAGHEPYAERLKQLARRLLPENAVTWKGWVSDMASVLAESDIFVHLPRDPEPLGRTAIEAGAAGLPSVVFNQGGLQEVIKDQVTGFIVPAGDVPGAVQALKTLCSDQPLCQRMGKEALQFTRERFSLERYLSQVESVYHSL